MATKKKTKAVTRRSKPTAKARAKKYARRAGSTALSASKIPLSLGGVVSGIAGYGLTSLVSPSVPMRLFSAILFGIGGHYILRHYAKA